MTTIETNLETIKVVGSGWEIVETGELRKSEMVD